VGFLWWMGIGEFLSSVYVGILGNFVGEVGYKKQKITPSPLRIK
jgi:hypothetical protein